MSSLRGRIVRYQGRKQHLLRLVEEVCALKRRPVCSTDLKAHLAQQEHAEIGYIQAWGQIMLKAAVVRPGSTPRLHAIGIHRYKTYYAPSDNPKWASAFERFCAEERAQYLIKRQFIYCLPEGQIPRSPLESIAAASMRWIVEDTAPPLEATMVRYRMDSWLRLHPASKVTRPIFNRLTRQEALLLLKQETARRADYIPTMNYNRHLARVSPTILRRGSPRVYCEELIRAYCPVHWPLPHEKPDTEAVSLLQWILAMIWIGRHPSA
jgi:hypothetical protein